MKQVLFATTEREAPGREVICPGFWVTAWQSPGCQVPRFSVLQSGRWSPKPGAVQMSAPRAHSASREDCLQLPRRSGWWSASALPRPLFPLGPYPMGCCALPSPAFSAAQHRQRLVCPHCCFRPAPAPGGLAGGCHQALDSQVSKEGNQTNPKALPPSTGLWAPRP